MAYRNADGTFGKGNPGGPGRPRRPTEDTYLAMLTDAVPPELWAQICARATVDALEGDAQARAWLSSYLMGRPQPCGCS